MSEPSKSKDQETAAATSDGNNDLIVESCLSDLSADPQPIMSVGLNMTVSDLRYWTIFSLLDNKFISKLRTVCVFGNMGNEAIMVTDDDEVYSIGYNGAGCLAVGDIHSILQPKKVDALSNKGIKKFAYGCGPHVLAITGDSDLLVWGHNGYTQLGIGTSAQWNNPTSVNGNLTGKTIVDVACGSYHSVALIDDGAVYAWGQNNCGQVGSGTTTNQPTPRKVALGLGSKKTIAIACGQTSTLALTDNGEVYSWGYNGNGQLGLGTNINQCTPARVNGIQGVVIVQIVCGYAHSLALSDQGEVYAWGANSYGQLGTGNKTNLCHPTRTVLEIGKVVDIAATHYSHISAAMTQSGRVYMWGQCRGQCVTAPTLTPFTSLHEAFACFSIPSVTYRPLSISTFNTARVSDAIGRAFDDQSTSDLKFLIDGQYIHVHKSILKIRCEHFQTMFQNHWEEDTQNVIEISQFSYSVYRAFLQYLYTDDVEIPAEDTIGLLDLANAYCEAELKRHCEFLIRQEITVDNVALLYATAIKYQAKDLEEFCLRFALNHMTAVTQTESFSHLDECTVKAFILQAAQRGAFRS